MYQRASKEVMDFNFSYIYNEHNIVSNELSKKELLQQPGSILYSTFFQGQEEGLWVYTHHIVHVT